LYSLIKSQIVAIFLTALALSVGLQNVYAVEQQTSFQTKGIAVYKELGIEYYVASLNLADINTAKSELLQYRGDQSLSIKVTAKRWSPRKWKAQWQNNIAINNEPSSDAELISQLAHFSQFPKASLKRGDEVIVTYSETAGSHVLFNGYSVLSTKNKIFYDYILNTWLGKFSPNRIFRDKISGQTALDAALIDISQQPVELARITKVKSWFSPGTASESEKKKQKLLAQQQKENLVKKQNKQAAVKKAQLEQKIKTEQANLEKSLQEAKARKKAKLIADQKAKDRKEKEQKERMRKKLLAQQAQDKKKRLALVEAEKIKLRKQYKQKYLYEFYQWQLQAKINESIVYPPWARQFSQEGRVALEFELNRAGNISSMNSSKSLASKILLQEVEKRLNILVESNGVPKELEGESWQFNINYVFDLSRTEQIELIKPQLATVE
jgi:outer membrane biosynthesis protein TonB